MSTSTSRVRDYLTDKNFLVSLITLVFSVALMIVTEDPSSNYPYIVFSLMAGLGALLMVNVAVKKNLSPASKLSWIEFAFLCVLLINPVLSKFIGFYVSAFIELFVISMFFISERKAKEVLKVLVFSLVVVAASYFVFKYGLRIRCPRGVLGLI